MADRFSTSLAMGLLVIAALLAPQRAGGSPAQGPPPATDEVILPEVRAMVPRLEQLMLEGIRTREPNGGVVARLAGESLFDGSFDWHSCLMATWCLLVQARTKQDEELGARLLERLTPAALEAEWERIDGLPVERMMTFPYDQGWLLLVLAELERHLDPVPEAVSGFRRTVEQRLLDWLEASPFPENDDPSKLDGHRFVGFYRSWLFTWIQVRLSEPADEEVRARLDALAIDRILPARADAGRQAEPFEFDFLWVPALVSLFDELEPGAEPVLLPEPELAALPETVRFSDVHVLGVELSRLWPLALRARAGEGQARERLNARLLEWIGRPDLWEQNFQLVAHWVPQFLWFTIWLADGRP